MVYELYGLSAEEIKIVEKWLFRFELCQCFRSCLCQ